MSSFESILAQSSIVVARAPVGSTTTHADSARSSDRLALQHALSARDVTDLLRALPSGQGVKPWQVWAPRLALTMALTGKQIAQLDTRQLSFRDGRTWISFPEPDELPNTTRPVRSIPLHPVLMAMRFAGFAHARFFADGREGPLFPELAGAARPGDAIESWLRRSTRWLAEGGRHAPTLRDLRATCAQAALDGGASVVAVESLMGLSVPLWDDRGAGDPAARARLQDERLIEAVEAVHFTGLDPDDPRGDATAAFLSSDPRGPSSWAEQPSPTV
jgi:integrase